MGLNVREAPGMHPAQKALIYPYFTDGESETQRGEATCVWPHSMLTAYIGRQLSSHLWSGVPSMPDSLCSALPCSLSQPCPQEISKVIPASAVGGESPGLLTQRCLWLLTGRRGSGYRGERRSPEASPGAAACSAQL